MKELKQRIHTAEKLLWEIHGMFMKEREEYEKTHLYEMLCTYFDDYPEGVISEYELSMEVEHG